MMPRGKRPGLGSELEISRAPPMRETVGCIKLHIFPWELLEPLLLVAFESKLGEVLGSAVSYKECSSFGRRME